MGRIVRQYLIAGVGCGAALLAVPGVRAEQGQPPPPIQGVTGTIALEGTIDQTSKATNTVVVKTVDGVRHLFHLNNKTAVHGAESVEVEGVRGLKAGSVVIVHYGGEAGEQTALEVDRLGDDGLQMMEGVVTHVDRAGRKMSIRLADGSTQTLRLTDHAATDAGKEVDRAASDRTKVVVYYTDDAGERVAHYFKRVS
jgi:hypothetical protein